jgi:ATP-dependent DNA ligase
METIKDLYRDTDGEAVCHACKLGLEGTVSKRLGSPYRPGRSRHWIKSRNPKAPGGDGPDANLG